jgi:hypothetical protein
LSCRFPQINLLVLPLLLSLSGESALAQDVAPTLDQSQTTIQPAWLGLTPLYIPEAASAAERHSATAAEDALIRGRRGFWIGLGGLLSSVLFDQTGLVVPRTLSYAVLGAGWSEWLGSYGEARSILGGTIGGQKLSRDNRFAKASTQGAIGEASNLFLIPDGVYLHPVYNDVNGSTDKFLTASAKIGAGQTYQSMGWESLYYWRLLTPSFKSQFGSPDYHEPVGRYADWREWKSSWASVTELGDFNLRHQISVGYNDVGSKGGKEFHRAFHHLTGNTLSHLDYTNQPEGHFFSVSAEEGIYSRICPGLLSCFDQLVSVEGSEGRFMTESGLRYNAVHVSAPQWWEQAVELRAIRQWHSMVYERIRPWRYEVAVGVRILKVVTPTVKYVSPYLYGDHIGQTYFDLLHYNYEF